jgi:hypothetical protein
MTTTVSFRFIGLFTAFVDDSGNHANHVLVFLNYRRWGCFDHLWEYPCILCEKAVVKKHSFKTLYTIDLSLCGDIKI